MATSRPPGRSLYASLIDPNANSSATITSEPVIYSQNQADDAAKIEAGRKQVSAAALRFQPSKRPQQQQQKPKPKGLPRPAAQPATSSSDKEAKSVNSPAPPVPKSTLADWTADDDLDHFYGGGPRAPRGGRKKRKKNKDQQEVIPQNWDDIYDPTRPNKYEEYKHSDEWVAEISEWRKRLRAHRRRSDSAAYPSETESVKQRGPFLNRKFAPPSSLSFAPPTSYDEPAGDSGSYSPDYVPEDTTGDDAYMRRMRLSGMAADQKPESNMSPQPPSFAQPPQPPSFAQQAPIFTPSRQPPAFQPSSEFTQANQPSESSDYVPSMQPPAFWQPEQQSTPQPPLQAPAFQPSSSSPLLQSQPKPIASSAVITSAPVRYNLPAAPSNLPANEEDLEAAIQQDEDETMVDAEEAQEEAPRSKAPGQKGFAERLMKKYGWSKGQGLGSEGTGIVTALAVKVEKRKKKSDAQGGGFVGPSGMGKIVGGKKKKGQDDGPGLTPVVVCRHMVDGMDLNFEMGPDGNLVEEIGLECAKNYGNIERVFIDRNTSLETVPVFLKFTEPISALRAQSALDGRVFAGNTVKAEFYDLDKFDQGIYE
ncbi:hypothetical protein EJ08DRAFT_677993 [Tothia fuscella]|uniref:G-patch domain-containing protein n=1 Tax=Tothia fuscella TaxID=1048955 RepID=A0A9P4NTD2_9PEZI|nr:hypothetical protein EJ08DRAFT_677993 [Tothia fuscella]